MSAKKRAVSPIHEDASNSGTTRNGLTVESEARALVDGSRQSDYGPPAEDFAKTAKMLTGILLPKLKPGCEVTARDFAMVMVACKLSRQINRHKRDNIVDAIGYLLTLAKIEGEEK